MTVSGSFEISSSCKILLIIGSSTMFADETPKLVGSVMLSSRCIVVLIAWTRTASASLLLLLPLPLRGDDG